MAYRILHLPTACYVRDGFGVEKYHGYSVSDGSYPELAVFNVKQHAADYLENVIGASIRGDHVYLSDVNSSKKGPYYPIKKHEFEVVEVGDGI